MSSLVVFFIICYLIGAPASWLYFERTQIGNVRCPVWLYKLYAFLWSPILVPALLMIFVGVAAVMVVCCPFEWACNRIGRLKDRLLTPQPKDFTSWVQIHKKASDHYNNYIQKWHNTKLKNSGNQMPPEIVTEAIQSKTRKLNGEWYNV